MVEQPAHAQSPIAGGSPDGAPPAPIVVVSPRPHTLWWILTVLVAVIATALVTRRGPDGLLERALAQYVSPAGASQAGARGIFAFTGQLTSRSYGLFMVDVDSGTVWCYEIQRGVNSDVQMKLVAARSWIYDRFLEEFNVGDPIPSAVRSMVQQQQGQRQAGVVPPTTGAAP